MQDFPLHGVYIDKNINNKYRNENNEILETRLCDACCFSYLYSNGCWASANNNGTVDIFTSDWAAGDTTVYRIYTVTDAGHLQISPKPDDTSVALTVDCDIRRLTSTQVIWNKPGTNEEISRFKKVK